MTPTAPDTTPADAGHTDETVQCPSLHTKKGSVNMKTSIKLCGLAAAVLMATAGSAMASDTVIPYVLDSQNKVVTNSTGLCWRTSFWTPALAEPVSYTHLTLPTNSRV